MSKFVEVGDNQIIHIGLDEFISGNIIIGDGYSLKTTDGNKTETIAGHSKHSGYREDSGGSRFNGSAGFIHLDPNTLIVSDRHNHCMRKIDRRTNRTDTYVGTCTIAGFRDGASALFNQTYAVIINNQQPDHLIVGDTGNKVLRTINTRNRMVRKLSNHTIERLRGMAQSANGDIYIARLEAVYKLTYDDMFLTLLAGHKERFGLRDGDFQQTLFKGAISISLLNHGKQILVADLHNQRLRLLDTTTNMTSSLLCHTSSINISTSDQYCSFYFPHSLLVKGNKLYIADNSSVSFIKGESLMYIL